MNKKYAIGLLVVFGFLIIAGADHERSSKQVDLLIVNGTIVTMDPGRTIIGAGTIAITDGKIVAVDDSGKVDHKARETIDATGKLVMPGLINTHTHAAMTIFRGYADDLPLMEWLQNYIWPAEAKYVNARNVRTGTRLAAVEMIRSGTTTFNDMYFFEDDVAKAAKEVGIRAMIGEGLLDFPTPNAKTPQDGLNFTEMLINKWRNDTLITVAVAPHSPYTCSPELLKDAKNLSDKYDVPLHIHVSETGQEYNDSINNHGMTPFGYLENLGFLGDNVIAAHSVHLNGEDIQLIALRSVGVSHNPESNMKLASGVAPLPALMETGAEIGLGTDGAASNNDLNMFEEMDTAAKLHKVFSKNSSVVDSKSVVEMATIGGAKVLGLDSMIGSIEKGKKADIILIDLGRPHLAPLYNPYSQIVYAVDGSDVETVIIDGRIVMRDQKILTVDEEEIIREARDLGVKIKQGV